MKEIVLALLYCLGIQYGFQEAEAKAEHELEYQKKESSNKLQEVLTILEHIKTGNTTNEK